MSGFVLEAHDLVVTRRAAPRGARRGREVRVVDGVSLALAGGERVGLTGGSGCGKSTLARALAGLLPAVAGEVRVGGRDLAGLRGAEARRVRRGVQLVFQDPGGSLDPRLRVGEALGEAMRAGRRGDGAASDEPARVAGLLAEMDLAPEAASAWPHALSGGQRQRVAIARALAAQPLALVADEPTVALDPTTQARVLALLQAACARRGLALLLISHDLTLVARACDRVLVMAAGLVVEELPAARAAAPWHPWSRVLSACTPRLSGPATADGPAPGPLPPAEPGDRAGGCPCRRGCPLAEPACAESVPPLDPAGPGRWLRCPPAARAVGNRL